MKLLSALLIALLATTAQAAAPCAVADPDFTWGAGCPALSRERLAASAAAWQSAHSPERYPKTSRKHVRPPDQDYLRDLLSRPGFTDAAPRLLDAAMRSEELLDKAGRLYAKAAAALPATARADALSGFSDASHLARARTRLAVGVARAGIARKMASSGNSSYSFQAMESAIDALRDSASEADKVPNCKDLAASVRKLRAFLLDVWDRAQQAKDPKLLEGIDLLEAFTQSFAPASHAERTEQ